MACLKYINLAVAATSRLRSTSGRPPREKGRALSVAALFSLEAVTNASAYRSLMQDHHTYCSEGDYPA